MTFPEEGHILLHTEPMIDFTVFRKLLDTISKKSVTFVNKYNGYLLLVFIVGFFVFFSLFLDNTLGAINKHSDTINFPTTAYRVYLNDEPIGSVYDKYTFDTLLSTIVTKYPWLESESFFREKLRFQEITVEKPLQPVGNLVQRLEDYAESVTKGWVISVEGKELVALFTEEEAEAVVRTIIERNSPQSNEGETIDSFTIQMVEAVEIASAIIEKEAIVDRNDAVRYIEKGTFEERTYEIVPNDTIWDLSRRYEISLDDIQKANPELELEKIFPGDIINLIVPKPFVTVEAQFVHIYPQRIPYRTQVIWDSRVFRDKTIEERTGISGEEVITAHVVLRNGREVEKTITEREILSRPQTRILRRGTKRTNEDVLVAKAILTADTGIISSFFGPRWGGYHYGVDIAIPIGTPVYTYDTGTVEFSGRYGSLGNVVIIDHDGKYTTKYGHLHKMHVKTGDRVMRRQYIADSGNTGYSTGPHVHFEVREQGRVIDPIVFLKNHNSFFQNADAQ